jgi:hypothetical protein
MATYLELEILLDDTDLRKRTCIAVIKAAQAKLDGTPTTNESKWAAALLEDPTSQNLKALSYVLAKNSDSSVATIQAASDATLQSNIDGIVDELVVAYNA